MATVKDVIAKLDLAQWTDVVVENTHVDLEVPRNKLSAFRKATRELTVAVMHDDLGASIRAENENHDAGCMCQCNPSKQEAQPPS